MATRHGDENCLFEPVDPAFSGGARGRAEPAADGAGNRGGPRLRDKKSGRYRCGRAAMPVQSRRDAVPQGGRQRRRGHGRLLRHRGRDLGPVAHENYKTLLGRLDDEQTTAARAMRRAWIAYRDTTCQFYDDKIRGSMSVMMHAACVTRETARRAMLRYSLADCETPQGPASRPMAEPSARFAD